MKGELPVVYLGLGSNLGDRRRNLAVALRRLEPLVRVEAVSSLYETDPVGPQQPPFYNAVCRGVTGLAPLGLLRHLQEVEHELGRRLGPRWGPRPIDIDLLLYGDAVLEERTAASARPDASSRGLRRETSSGSVEPTLRVPHRELARRAFVLLPLVELAAEVRHPELGRTISSLADAADPSGVRKCADAGWEQG